MSRLIIIFLLFLFAFHHSDLFSQDTTTITQTDTIDSHFQDSVNLNLLIAAEKGDINSLLESIRSGAEINSTTYQGVTSLMYAAQADHLDITQILLHNGADPNIQPQDGTTALISAIIFNNIDIADQLIQHGADIKYCDNFSFSPLMYASVYGYFVMTDMLIYYGADIDQRSDDSTNSIIMASLNGKNHIVDLLIQKGADVNSSDKNGFTPLIVAAQNGHYDIVKLLTENGALLNHKTKYGFTPLYYAANNGYTDIVKLLLEKGAIVNEKFQGNKNLASLPSIYNYPLIRKMLKEKGLKLNYWPGFHSLIIGYGINFNNKDILLGGIIGINDYKYNIGISLGYEMRYWAKPTLVEQNPDLYYQFWEKRSTIHVTTEKRFSIISRLKSETGCLLGGKGLFTFGSYRGSSTHPDSKFKFAPQAGIYYSMKIFSVKLLYEYIDYGNFEVPPYRINVQLLLNIDLVKYRKYDKELRWLAY